VPRWLAQDDIDSGQRDGLTTAEREELLRLRRELRVVREERDVLAKAIAFSLKTRPGEPLPVHRGGEGASLARVAVPRGRRGQQRVLRLAAPAISARARADEHLTDEIKDIFEASAARTERHASMPSCVTAANGWAASAWHG
jgi:hypothetical protein